MGSKTFGRKVREREKLNNEVNSLNDVTPEDSLLEGLGQDVTLNSERTIRHKANDNASNIEGHADASGGEIVKKEKRKKRKLEKSDPDIETQKLSEQDKVGENDAGEIKDDSTGADPGLGVNMDQQKDGKIGLENNFESRLGKERIKNHKVKRSKDVTASPSYVISFLKDNSSEEVKEDIYEMDNGENGNNKKKKTKKQKKHEDLSDDLVIKSVTNRKDGQHARAYLGDKSMDNVQSPRKKRKKRKQHDDVDLEAALPKVISKIHSNECDDILEDRVDRESVENKAGEGAAKAQVGKKDEKKRKKQKRKRTVDDIGAVSGGIDGKRVICERELLVENIREKAAENGGDIDLAENKEGEGMPTAEDGNKDEKKRKKRKRESGASNNGVVSSGIAGKGIGNERHLEENIIGRLDDSRKERKKKNNHNIDLEAASKKIMNEKLCNESRKLGENEGNKHPIESKAGNEVKMKKAKSVRNGLEGHGISGIEQRKDGVVDPSIKSTPKGTFKRVSFSEDVEIFPSSDGPGDEGAIQKGELVQGKRFSCEEDELVKEAVLNYINNHGLGEEGLQMVLQCKKYPEVKNCWKEIGAALPWRPHQSVYYRAHILFERGEKHSWTEEEYELVQKFHEKHGSDWKTLAEVLGKHRFHVKDTWRRIKFTNRNKGRWSQDEYQSLFDLVNMDLRMKAFEERKTKHGMLRDNICWTAISDKLGTRATATCCMKWYDQLTSPLVAEGKWLDVDDYRLLIALYATDACCMEDVDWDSLLEHRPGDVCRKRWNQMVKHLGEHSNDSFADQVEVLMKRYCPDVLEARETYDSKPVVD